MHGGAVRVLGMHHRAQAHRREGHLLARREPLVPATHAHGKRLLRARKDNDMQDIERLRL
eukprot:694829-Rhodomonas_salina.6